LFIGIQGGFAPWVGALLGNVAQKLVVVVPEGREEETITRLARVGFDHVLGYLQGGIAAWKTAGFETESIASIPPETFAAQLTTGSYIIDARKPGEFEAEHVKNAINLPLDSILENLHSVPTETPFFLHCTGGYRSVIMASILKARGFNNMINVEKGINGIKQTSVQCTQFECHSTKNKS